MMAQSRAESTRDTYNYGQYLNQFPPNTIKVIREFERIQKRICRHKMSIMFNEICINEEMLPKYTYIYIYIYITVLVFTISLLGFVADQMRYNLECSISVIELLYNNNKEIYVSFYIYLIAWKLVGDHRFHDVMKPVVAVKLLCYYIGDCYISNIYE